ncbi:hypothetical protein KKA09_01895 [Patescibacteria group bacterium]|nr:hypothetical protein [Patescibacteria group bacterium]
MENIESKNQESIKCDRDFILKNLKLVADNESESKKFLKLEADLLVDNTNAERLEKTSIDSPETLFRYFESAKIVKPDKICRPKGDTTFFTSAGVQHIETILREKGNFKKEQFAIAQPVIRSQFIDKVKEGTSTSFINFSVESIDTTPDEFIALCNKFIKLILNQGVNTRDLKFVAKDSSVKWGDKKFSNVFLKVYFNNIEIGECIYIYDYPITENEKVSIADIGFGVERLNWAIGKDKYYLPEYKNFYVNKIDKDKDKITSIIDCVRSMVLIVGDGIKPSNHDHGYRIRQFSKRFVFRNQRMGMNVAELIHLSYENWEKWGYKFSVSEKDIIEIIKLENDRNFNGLFLSKLRKIEKIDIYADINQNTTKFLHQVSFSLPKELVAKILETIK